MAATAAEVRPPSCARHRRRRRHRRRHRPATRTTSRPWVTRRATMARTRRSPTARPRAPSWPTLPARRKGGPSSRARATRADLPRRTAPHGARCHRDAACRRASVLMMVTWATGRRSIAPRSPFRRASPTPSTSWCARRRTRRRCHRRCFFWRRRHRRRRRGRRTRKTARAVVTIGTLLRV